MVSVPSWCQKLSLLCCGVFLSLQVEFDSFVAQGKVLQNYAHIFSLLLRMRQVCNHPYLVLRWVAPHGAACTRCSTGERRAGQAGRAGMAGQVWGMRGRDGMRTHSLPLELHIQPIKWPAELSLIAGRNPHSYSLGSSEDGETWRRREDWEMRGALSEGF